MSQIYFITGTDTGIGKTYFTTGLLQALKKLGYSTLGIKPIASGAEYYQGKLRNQDALAIQQASSIKLPYENINPFCFEQPIAPHIAAQQTNTLLNCQQVSRGCEHALNTNADYIIIEGAGGWLTPLNHQQTMADWIQEYCVNIIVVVGIRVGCLNHAQLTVQTIQQSNQKISGWVGNSFKKNTSYTCEQINTLKHKLNISFLGEVKFNSGISLELSKRIINHKRSVEI